MTDHVYVITDWEAVFVRGDLRKTVQWSWIGLPLMLDTAPYKRMVARPRGPELCWCYVACCMVAARMPIKGVLADERGPLDAVDLASLTGLEYGLVELFLEVAQEERVQWLLVREWTQELAQHVQEARLARIRIPSGYHPDDDAQGDGSSGSAGDSSGRGRHSSGSRRANAKKTPRKPVANSGRKARSSGRKAGSSGSDAALSGHPENGRIHPDKPPENLDYSTVHNSTVQNRRSTRARGVADDELFRRLWALFSARAPSIALPYATEGAWRELVAAGAVDAERVSVVEAYYAKRESPSFDPSKPGKWRQSLGALLQNWEEDVAFMEREVNAPPPRQLEGEDDAARMMTPEEIEAANRATDLAGVRERLRRRAAPADGGMGERANGRGKALTVNGGNPK